MPDAPRDERFWQHVKKTATCWLWVGASWQGYGRLMRNGRTQKAHRFAWELLRGPIPVGLNVLHRCDNPACVRPEHLFLGTQKDNAQDMAAKGRAHLQRDPMGLARTKNWKERMQLTRPRGSAHHGARLNECKVVEIRERYAVGAVAQELADEFGVSVATIHLVAIGGVWKHVGGPRTRRRQRGAA